MSEMQSARVCVVKFYPHTEMTLTQLLSLLDIMMFMRDYGE